MKFWKGTHLALFDENLHRFWEVASDGGAPKPILLQRKNSLARYVSLLVSLKRKSYQVRANEPEQHVPAVKVDVNNVRIGQYPSGSLVEFCDKVEAEYKKVASLVGENLLLTYEDDILADPLQGYSKVCKFLDISPEPAQPRYRKVVNVPIREIVSNWHEVEQALSGTAHSWMLD